MSPQERIDASVRRTYGPSGCRIRFDATTLPAGKAVVPTSPRSVSVSADWIEGIDDAMLDHVVVHECEHRLNQTREEYNVAMDAIVSDAIEADRYILASGTSDGRPLFDSSRFIQMRVTMNGDVLDFAVAPDETDGLSEQERTDEIRRRLEEAGYVVGEPVGLDTSRSMDGHYDMPSILSEIDSLTRKRDGLLGIGRRPGGAVVLPEGDEPRRRMAAREMLAAGEPMVERFERQDENDRWNRSRGRRKGGVGKGRGR